MRVAVIGGTGLIGRHTVAALDKSGHQSVIVSRSKGIDVEIGNGLDQALAGVEAVVDVTNVETPDVESTRKIFGTITKNLLEAEMRAKVKHHVLLSIVGVDLIKGNAHYAGKRFQEELVTSSNVPHTIVRATEFHEFAEMVVQWTRKDNVATVPPALIQPIAAADVGKVLAEVAVGKPLGRLDIAGPEPQDLFDMARRTLNARGESIKLVPSWNGVPYGVEAAGEILLPGPTARLEATTFDQWLKSLATTAAASS